jgi:SAM-dependent methyltransferase
MFGETYSQIYDEVHSGKDYESEAKQVLSILNSVVNSGNPLVLDFGCGTGRHADKLREYGIKIRGYDPNPFMVGQARKNFPDISVTDKIEQLPNNFDFLYSLFDVFSYQLSDLEVSLFLDQMNSLVKPNAWILIDGWHLPGLEIDPPKSRSRSFQHNGQTLSRNVDVVSIDGLRVSELNISIRDLATSKEIFSEIHTLRAFDSSEIQVLIRNLGGHELTFFDGTDFTKPLTNNSWRFAAVFQTASE